MLAREALDELTSDLPQLADEIGVSYSSLKKWRQGDRTPSEANLRKLARAASNRAGALLVIAARLSNAADEER